MLVLAEPRKKRRRAKTTRHCSALQFGEFETKGATLHLDHGSQDSSALNRDRRPRPADAPMARASLLRPRSGAGAGNAEQRACGATISAVVAVRLARPVGSVPRKKLATPKTFMHTLRNFFGSVSVDTLA